MDDRNFENEEEPTHLDVPLEMHFSPHTTNLSENDDVCVDHYANFNKFRTLSLQLRKTCSNTRPHRETDTDVSAKIFYQMGILYMDQSSNKTNMLSLIRAAALFNAAIARNSINVSLVRESLRKLCYHIQKKAGCSKREDLIQQAEQVKIGVKSMRDKAKNALGSLQNIPDYLETEELFLRQKQKTEKVKEIQDGVTQDYKRIMANICQFCEKVMGKSPCQYVLVGMGSLARKEITPYSDFEHFIILQNNCRDQFSIKGYEETLKYFRWYSVIFHVVIINLGETIIPSLAIPDLNDPTSELGDWFFDAYTKRGISFDGMMPHASKFPLGREATADKPFATELIKPVNEMLDFLNSSESLRQGYHLADILTKTCFVYGNKSVYNNFTQGVSQKLRSALKNDSFENIKDQVKEDLTNFSIHNKALFELQSNSMFNVKRLVYRSTTIFISAWGRLEGIDASSSFDIISELKHKNVISDYVKGKLMFAVALACEIRLRTYLAKGRQDDMYEPAARNRSEEHSFVKVVGKSSLINYFQVAYALQASICTHLDARANRSFPIADPITFNVQVCSALGLEHMTTGLSQISSTSTAAVVDIFDFEDCLTCLEEGLQTKFDGYLSHHEMTTSSEVNAFSKKNLAFRHSYVSKYLYHQNRYDEALHYAAKAREIMESATKEKAVFHASCFELTGYCLAELKQYQQALECLNKCFKIYESISVDKANEFSPASSTLFYYKGLCYEKIGDFKSAAKCFSRALPLYEAEIADKHAAAIRFHLGVCLSNTKEYTLSYMHIKNALQTYQELQNDEGIHNEIAKALRLFVKSYKMKSLTLNDFKDLNDFRITFQKYSLLVDDMCLNTEISLIFLNIGKDLMELQLLDIAYFWMQKSLTTYTTLVHDLHHDKIAGDMFCNIGLCLMRRTQHQHSLRYLKKALEVYKKLTHDVNADQDIAETLRRIGLCFLKMNNYSKARVHLQNALKIYEKNVSVCSEIEKNVAEVCDDIGVCLMEMNDYEASFEFLENSLIIKKKISSDIGRDDEVALTLNNMGNCLLKLNKLVQSLNSFQKALKIQKVTRTTAFGTITTMNNVGLCLMAMNYFHQAAAYFEKAKLHIEEIFEYDNSHGSIAKRHMIDTLNNIGSSYLSVERYGKALSAFKDALNYLKTVVSNAGTDQLKFYLLNNIGFCYMRWKSYNCALDYFEHSLNVLECEVSAQQSLNSSAHDDLCLSVAALHNNIGLCLMHTKRIEKAILHFQKSVDLYRRATSTCDKDLATVLQNVAIANMNKGCTADSLRYFDNARFLFYKSSIDPETDRKIADHLFIIGIYKKHLGFHENALYHFERSLSIMRRISANEMEDQSVIRCLHECGLCLYALGRVKNSRIEKMFFEMSLKLIGYFAYPTISFKDYENEFSYESIPQQSPKENGLLYTDEHFYDKAA